MREDVDAAHRDEEAAGRLRRGRRAEWSATVRCLDDLARRLERLRSTFPVDAPDAGPLLPAGPYGTAHWSLLTDRVSWSDEVFAVLGRPVREGPLTLDELPSLLVPQDQPLLTAAVTGCLVDGRPAECVYRVNGPDGTRRTVRMTAEPVVDADGGTVAMRAVFQRVGGAGREQALARGGR
ncbi:hypothetical protein GCM10009716_17000 [Streptomyces sodiiphilus]|uniref:PAS fold-3 domain-containing protein n=2 Tax=Streptomyces sodiiphilus TaxID=226217 RepID=A0ABP5A974_9ACTN